MKPCNQPRKGLPRFHFHALAILAGLTSSTLAQEPPPSPASPDKAPIVVPFQTLASNHMVVEVKLNGKGPYTLIFDVGSPVTLLSNRAAKGSGLIQDKGRGFPMLFGAQGAEEVDELQVGDLVAKNVPVLVMDHPLVGALGQVLGRPLDGLMGHTFFARYKTTIDYQAGTMAFEPVDSEIRDLFAQLPDRLMGPKKARRVILEPAALFGFRVGPANDNLTEGVPVLEVIPDSPAAEAGLQAGDLLTTFDGRWTSSIPDVYQAASRVEPQKPVELTISRNGKPQTLTLTPRPGF